MYSGTQWTKKDTRFFQHADGFVELLVIGGNSYSLSVNRGLKRPLTTDHCDVNRRPRL